MNDTTVTENRPMTAEQLMQELKARANDAGLNVRCPTCGTGIGKWCRDSKGGVIVHEARKAEAR